MVATAKAIIKALTILTAFDLLLVSAWIAIVYRKEIRAAIKKIFRNWRKTT